MSSSRTVVTRTMVSETTSEGGMVTRQETRTVQQESRQSGDGPTVTHVTTSSSSTVEGPDGTSSQAVTASGEHSLPAYFLSVYLWWWNCYRCGVFSHFL